MLRLLVPAALFLASIILFFYGDDIEAGSRGAWDHGRAQAAAEGRRARDTWARARAGRPGRGMRAAAGHARDFWRGMRGPRSGAPAGSPGAAVPAGAGPAYRVGRAARHGGRAAVGAARTAGRGGGEGITAGARGARSLWSRRPRILGGAPRPAAVQPGGSRVPHVPSGVCDQCGRFVARPSLERTTGSDGQLWCVLCRNAGAPRPAAPAIPAIPAPRLGDASGSPAAPAVTVGTGWPSTAGVTGAIPAGTVTAGTGWPAITAGTDSPEVADGEIVQPAALTTTTGTAPAALPAGSGIPAGPATQPALTGGSMTDLVPRRAGVPAIGGAGGQLAQAGGSNIVHGQFVRYVQMLVQALNNVWREQQAMLAELNNPDVDGSAEQIRDVEAWADRITAAAKLTRAWVLSADSRLGPLVDQIAALGGPQNVASPAYHSDY